jgi:hypothetical protein
MCCGAKHTASDKNQKWKDTNNTRILNPQGVRRAHTYWGSKGDVGGIREICRIGEVGSKGEVGGMMLRLLAHARRVQLAEPISSEEL